MRGPDGGLCRPDGRRVGADSRETAGCWHGSPAAPLASIACPPRHPATPAMPALFVPDGRRLVPTERARGPWSPNALHGGPVAALVARAAESQPGGEELQLARITLELLRPVPLAPPGGDQRAGQARPHGPVGRHGDRSRRGGGGLVAGPPHPPRPGGPAGGADGARGRRPRSSRRVGATAMVIGELTGLPQPGHGDAVRAAAAPTARVRPRCGSACAVRWSSGRSRRPGRRAAAAADFGNGVAAELDFGSSSFINPDLTVSLHRPPVGEWICLDARTRFGTPGIGAAESALWDTEGRIGRSVQNLVVEVRRDRRPRSHRQHRAERRRAPGGPGRGRPSRPPLRGRAVELARGGVGQRRPRLVDPVGRPAPGPLHIGVLLGNVPEYVFWLGAAALAGAVVVGINPTRRGEALAGDIVRTDCQVLVTDADGARLLDGLDFGVPADRVIRVDDAGLRRRARRRTRAPTARAVVAGSAPAPERPLPPAVHLGHHRRAQGGAVHPGTAGRRSPCGRPRPTASTATTWPTAPCRCSTATP